MSDPKMGLWPSPDSKSSPIFYNFGHDGTVSIRNFVLMMVQMLKSRLEPKGLVACVACRLRPLKLKKCNMCIMVLYINIEVTQFDF
jgi:hypothetical protein